MDELGYEWYTGFKTPRAVGETVKEALEVYVGDGVKREGAEGAHAAGGAPLAAEEPAGKRPRSAIEFAGIALQVAHKDQIEILDKTNKAIERWLPVCMAQVFRDHPESPCNAKTRQHDDHGECEVSTIRLQRSHHVTLFYFAQHDPQKEADDPVAKRALEEMHSLEPEMRRLWDALTPYEFAVAALYRRFYGIKLPFEVADADATACTATPLDSPRKYVPITLKHVVFVPGVVMYATALLGRGLVAVPAPDGTFGPYERFQRGGHSTMEKLLRSCQDARGVIIEEDHCTHVTLGVTKEYKPVVSNNICRAIRDYLLYVEKHANAKASERLWTIKTVRADKAVCDMPPKQLLRCLEIYSSGFSEFKLAKRAFVQLAPHAVAHEDDAALARAAKHTTIEIAQPPKERPAKFERLYRRTECFVAEDGTWIYIRRLPVDRSLDESERPPDDWVVDAYICSLGKTVTGELRFF